MVVWVTQDVDHLIKTLSILIEIVIEIDLEIVTGGGIVVLPSDTDQVLSLDLCYKMKFLFKGSRSRDRRRHRSRSRDHRRDRDHSRDRKRRRENGDSHVNTETVRQYGEYAGEME